MVVLRKILSTENKVYTLVKDLDSNTDLIGRELYLLHSSYSHIKVTIRRYHF